MPQHNTKLYVRYLVNFSKKKSVALKPSNETLPCKQNEYISYLHAINQTTDSTEPTHTLQFLACAKNDVSYAFTDILLMSVPHFNLGSWILNWLMNWNPSTNRYNNSSASSSILQLRWGTPTIHFKYSKLEPLKLFTLYEFISIQGLSGWKLFHF